MERDESGLSRLHRILLSYLFQDRNEEEESSVQNPPCNTIPQTPQTLVDHPLHAEVLSVTGSGLNLKDNSVYRMLQQRERNMGVTRRPQNSHMRQMRCCPLSNRSKTHILQRYLPNKSSQVASYRDAVFCGMFSQDGTLFMSACKDEHIRIYDSESWQKVNSIPAREVGWSIISTDYSPDQQWLIYSSWSSFVHLANTKGEHQVHEALDFSPKASKFCLFSVQFSPDSREILGGSSDRHLYIYDLDRRVRTERVLAHKDDINTVAYADHTNQIIYSGSDDSLIKVWDRREFTKCKGVLPGHLHGITYIDSKQDGNYLISNSKDQTIKLWDIRHMSNANTTSNMGRESTFEYNSFHGYRQFEALNQRRIQHKDDQSIMTYRGHKVLQTLIRCRFSPRFSTGQKYIYSGSFDGSVYVYDLLSGSLLKKLSGHSSTVRDVHWHPVKPQIVSTSWDGRVLTWDCETDDLSTPTIQEEPVIDYDYYY